MNYSELIQLYFERSNALQWYWTLYVVVVGGLLAFVSIRKQRDLFTGVLVTVLFCFFAYKNLDGIHDVTVQRFAVLEAIQQFAPPGGVAPDLARGRRLIEPTLLPPGYAGVRVFHWASDLLTLAAMWTMELRRKKNA